ncbi:MAG: hypothetical protein WCO45_08245 [Pseudanabaena sp. ELA607]
MGYIVPTDGKLDINEIAGISLFDGALAETIGNKVTLAWRFILSEKIVLSRLL